MRMRYAAEAVREIRKMDPDSAISERMIRRLIRQGLVPSIPTGDGTRRMVDLDVLLDYFAVSSKLRQL